MPATDWREITFSRSHLRPHDGYDPDVRKLRRKVVEIARKKQVQAYMQAKTLLETAEGKEQGMRDKVRAEELGRQGKERVNLAEAFKMRALSFDEEWAHKRKVIQHEVADKRKGFEDRVEGQTTALELQINKKANTNIKLFKGSPIPPVIFSSLVRDDRQIEARQAEAGNFEIATRYNNSLKHQMQSETKRHEQNCANVITQKHRLLTERLAQERHDMEDACDRMCLAFELKYSIAQQRQKQSIKNLTHDSEHAMAMEFCAAQEVRYSLTQSRTQPKSYQSRPKTSSTFMGRNLMEKAGRGAMDVPSVCKMEATTVRGCSWMRRGKQNPCVGTPMPKHLVLEVLAKKKGSALKQPRSK
mmetsp:Transcript_23060/g.36931  ORF Transcript_23060/g.36931 Transcript_23060/m.36931 type:complete len:358 (-) Transcript_23060:56-1129(-)